MAVAADLSGGKVPHPRVCQVLFGQDEPAHALAAAHAAGRLHHAWLLGGPRGVGKATLAYRFARWLLAPAAERLPGGDGLAVDPDGRTFRQVAAGSHPNLATVERVSADGEKAPPKTIGVDAVRRALSFFSGTAADGGRRICIVDSIDELTAQAANALLKTVEEPPPGALILIVSHAPQRVLPTIRSRCRRLPVRALSAAEVARVLVTLLPEDEHDPALVQRSVAIADGSVLRALALLDRKRISLLDDVDSLLGGLPSLPMSRLLALAEKVGDRRAEDEFGFVVDGIERWLSARIEARQGLGAVRLAPLAEVCENIREAARTVEVYNLDRRAFIVSTFGELAEAVRRAA